AKCWLCGRELVLTADVVDEASESPFAASWSPRVGVEPRPFQFSLESLLLVITLAAVCLGAFVATPGLGVLALIVAAPALLRTVYEGHQARRRGKAMDVSEKLLSFMASAGIALAALTAAAGAFFAACTASILAVCFAAEANRGQALGSGTENTIFIVCAIVCVAASLAAFASIFWLTWPKRG
ncbi:MAG TPA: hypothetical protein VFV87_21105, partial [Pirellulaceae bacterium]|nr:hypothetical protein [Pirellulaceae bacterium]